MTDPISNERLARELWKKHGGAQHGPRTETLYMPEVNFAGFIADMLQSSRQSPAGAECEADEYIDQLNALCEDFGCEPGSDRLHWLHEKLSSLSVKEQEGYSAEDGLRRVREIAIQSVAAPFCMSEIVKVADMALGENTALPGWMGDLASHEPASGDTQDGLPLTDEAQGLEGVEPVADLIRQALRELDNVTALNDQDANCLGAAENLLRQALAPSPPKAVTLRIDPTKPGNALSQLRLRLTVALSSEAHNG